jgi:hypothetical protein
MRNKFVRWTVTPLKGSPSSFILHAAICLGLIFDRFTTTLKKDERMISSTKEETGDRHQAASERSGKERRPGKGVGKEEVSILSGGCMDVGYMEA